jgi:hypothetical protein
MKSKMIFATAFHACWRSSKSNLDSLYNSCYSVFTVLVTD